jgi:hypothetical protein
MAPEEIPVKLRCATCSKLALNAFRLPCCEQPICETCQSNLSSSCPVCEHSPLSAEDCNPNKALRTTIKVFLRTAEKKREVTHAKESAPPTPVEATKSAQLPAADESSAVQHATSGDVTRGDPSQAVSANADADADAAHDTAARADQDSTNEIVLATQKDEGAESSSHNNEAGGDAAEGLEGAREGPERDDAADQDIEEVDASTQDQEKDGADGINNGYSNMNFAGASGGGSGDFNQMQMMMAMQNGMGNGAFGGFPMMTMPGMGMDPMTMQNMYMNGGFQGMGMNGMGNFGGFGQGSNNNWNGSQTWNFDQNNYNQNGPGMGAGDFGSFNSGFQQTGYNQGNQSHQFNDYRRNNFARGRGRGRGFYGGYGRGGGHQYGNQNYQQQYGNNYQLPSIHPSSLTRGNRPKSSKSKAGGE